MAQIPKKNSKKLACLTAYDYPTARILDDAGIDIILVGDSVGNVVLGYNNTSPVTLADMIHHGKAVRRGVKNSFFAVDMPFSVEGDYLEAVRTLAKETQADAIKIEGIDHLEDIRELIKDGIKIIGHLGYLPQTDVKASLKGKEDEEVKSILSSAKLLQEAGVFAIVLELVQQDAAKIITDKLYIPTISCGSGYFCDGQVLVTHDIVGLYAGKSPKFAKQYVDLGSQFKRAVEQYIIDIRA